MKTKKAIIIGGGIAGLCAGTYLRKNGFETEIVEMHSIAGGLATAWKRGRYTFENCIHWFVGSKDGEFLNSTWKEIFDVGKLEFHYDPIYQVIEKGGSRLTIYRDIDRLEKELLAKASEDALEIRQFTRLVRKLSFMKLPGGDHWIGRLFSYLRAAPYLWRARKYSKFTLGEYGQRFSDRLLKRFFLSGFKELSLLAIAFSLAWMSKGNAGYPIGGSLALINLIEEQYKKLGGVLRLGTKVERVIVEDGKATGVLLEGGESLMSDVVISAADGHATIFHFLQGCFLSEKIEKVFETYKPFPSYIQVSFGIDSDFGDKPGFITICLDRPIMIDPKTNIDTLSFRIFNFDPTFAPQGKTAVVCFIPTYNNEYWTSLREASRSRYASEKERVAGMALEVFEEKFPEAQGNIEVVDVATPATVIRYTGNWKGSMEGWLYTPSTGIKQLPLTLPNLRNFYMIGQWVSPGGGLPSGLMTARDAAKMICRENHMKFRPN
jgi:phytoene dehydrogenase-like protein